MEKKNKDTLDTIQLADKMLKDTGLNNYTKENQLILLEKFDIEEVKIYVKLEKALLPKHIFKVEREGNDALFVGTRGPFLVGYSPKKLQVTNHTLYTFLEEFGLKPSDLKKV